MADRLPLEVRRMLEPEWRALFSDEAPETVLRSIVY